MRAPSITAGSRVTYSLATPSGMIACASAIRVCAIIAVERAVAAITREQSVLFTRAS
jgi:hypothetical protein